MAAQTQRNRLVDEVWCAFLGSGRAIHARARVGISSGGLTMPRVTLLRIIVYRGKSSSRELAESMGVSSPDLPGLLDKLAGEGLITRERSSKDRRVVLVESTPKGRRKLESLRRAAIDELARMFDEWSDADLRTFRDLLARTAPRNYCVPSRDALPVIPANGRGRRIRRD